MADNDSSIVSEDTLQNNQRRRSARIANIEASLESSNKPSTSGYKGGKSVNSQLKSRLSVAEKNLKRKRANSISSIESSVSKSSTSSKRSRTTATLKPSRGKSTTVDKSKSSTKSKSVTKPRTDKPKLTLVPRLKTTLVAPKAKTNQPIAKHTYAKPTTYSADKKDNKRIQNNISKATCSTSKMDQSNNDESSNNRANNGSNIENNTTNNVDATVNLNELSVNLGYFEDERDISRLHALLENRGLPAQLFSALHSFGPRVHQLIQRQMGSGILQQVHQLHAGLISTDESQQMTAAVEMSQLLVMGNEESLAAFPIKPVVTALINIMRNETNFPLVNHACRALTYMMESLPRTSNLIVDATPIFLDKLRVIQCIDVAEQSLSALAKLSKRHSSSLLKAGAVSTCLQFIDFFSIPSQRTALTISLNCCQAAALVHIDLVIESSQLLIQRLNQQDQRSLEIVCQSFITLVENFKSSQKFIEHLLNNQIVEKLLPLLVVRPQITSPQTFVQLLHMLVTMCTVCPNASVLMLTNNIADTLYTLLVNNCTDDGRFDLAQRSPLETFEIVSLIAEIMPMLPKDGIFAIDFDAKEEDTENIPASSVNSVNQIHWQFDAKSTGNFTDYNISDSTDIELLHTKYKQMAFQMGELEVQLDQGESKVLFRTMGQLFTSSGKFMPIRRGTRSNKPTNAIKDEVTILKHDVRISMLSEHPDLLATFITKLFIVLYQVYNSSAGPSVHQKCLQAILRMIHHAPASLLASVLSCNVVASCIASMLTSSHIGAVVNGLQMTTILMQKMPKQFNSFFRREGVLHQIEKLTARDYYKPVEIVPTPTPNNIPSKSTMSDSDVDIEIIDSPDTCKKTRSTSGKNILIKKRKNSTIKSSNISLLTGSSSVNSTSQSTSEIGHISMPFSPGSAGPATLSATSTSGLLGLGDGNSISLSEESFKSRMESLAVKRISRKSQPSKMEGNNHTSFLNMLHYGNAGQAATSTTFSSLGSTSKAVTSEATAIPAGTTTCSHSSTSAPEDLSTVDALSTTNTSEDTSQPGSSRVLRNKKKSNEPSKEKSSTSANQPSTSSTKVTSTSTPSHKRPSSKGLLNSFFGGSRWRSNGPHSSNSENMSNLMAASKSNASMMNYDEMKSHKKSALSAQQTSLSYAKSRNSVQNWIGIQAKELIATYFPDDETNINELIQSISITSKLKTYPDVLRKLNQNKRDDILTMLSLTQDIIVKGDATAFELLQSGMVYVLLLYFNHSVSKYGQAISSVENTDEFVTKEERIQLFSDVFCTKDENKEYGIVKLIERLVDCLHHYEQLHVKVLDLPEGGTSCMKFINNNQLKCLLSKHSSCSQLKPWRGGPVKIDPLAVMSSLERYLILRGYTTDTEELYSEDETEDDEEMDEHFHIHGSMPCNHRIEFLIGEHVLPYSMTVYEAVRLYSPALARNHDGNCLSTAQIWGHTHILHYRFKPIEKTNNDIPVVVVKSKTKIAPTSNDLSASTLASDPYQHIANIKPIAKCVSFKDRCLPILSLLKIIHNLITYGSNFMENSKLIRSICAPFFQSSKLDVKVLRQVNDPLVVLTADLPKWIPEICKVCPFLIPFATREVVFASTCFDRIRLLVRLQENHRESNGQSSTANSSTGSNNTSRMMPRLERKKRIVDRNKILQQAETLFKDMAGDKSLLEIQYTNEVGTGLGPTLEFYSLVSKELQRSDLDLWRGESITEQKISPDTEDCIKTIYTFNQNGLFFKPLPVLTKKNNINAKKRNYLILLGQFMAKSLNDSRMIDIHLSIPFYKWMLGQENTMSIDDLEFISPSLGSTFKSLNKIVQKRYMLEKELKLTKGEKHDQIDALTLDGCLISDLCFDFTLPGYPGIELMKYGSTTPVTIYNLDQYMKLVLQISLVTGVRNQFEYVKKGFNQVFSLEKLKIFYPNEMDQLLCGNNFKAWTVDELMRCTKCDHGYTIESPAIGFLFSLLASYDIEEQREFLRFITGSPRLPIGGLASLNPPLTIVKKYVDETCSPDDFLPSVMTCVNYLKLPAYSDAAVLCIQLKKASQMGQGSFHLS